MPQLEGKVAWVTGAGSGIGEAAAQCVTVALPLMRKNKDGLIVHTASMAGRFIGGFPGPLYTAAKHGVVAMSHSINMQE